MHSIRVQVHVDFFQTCWTDLTRANNKMVRLLSVAAVCWCVVSSVGDSGFEQFFSTNLKEVLNSPINFEKPIPKWLNGSLVRKLFISTLNECQVYLICKVDKMIFQIIEIKKILLELKFCKISTTS